MDFLIGIIPAVIAFAAFSAYKSTKVVSLKKYCLQLPILIILTSASLFFLIKWYEVPIHFNRISYVFARNDSPYKKFDGNTAIKVTYDYNSYKGMQDLFVGLPVKAKPGFIIETCVKGDSLTGSHHSEGCGTATYYIGEDTINVSLRDIEQEGWALVRNDKEYLNYLKSEGINPLAEGSIGGALLCVDVNGSNRQFVYPFDFYTTHQHDYLTKDSILYSRILLPYDTLASAYDSLRVTHLREYYKPHKRTKNSSRSTSYSYIPNTDSIIYQYLPMYRTDYFSPSYIWTAEDISRAVEILSFRGLMDNNINLKLLSFDYIGPADFSEMDPEPDQKDISKITFTNKEKLDKIKRKGIRFHVKFPDMENIQQIRMFIVTLILGGLFAKFLLVMYHIIRECYQRNYFNLQHISKRWAYICYTLFIVVFLIVFALTIYHSKVNAFDLDDDSHFGVISIIKK